MSAPNDNEPGSSARPAKAISSFAKRPSETTRQGTQKLKFAPTLPVRRKKEEVKAEPSDSLPSTPARDRGRGRGRGDGRGRGRGGTPRAPVEMTASGPFAMGPAMAGNMGARRAPPRSNFAPVPISTPGSSMPSSLSNTPAPSMKRDEDKGKGKAKVEDDEVYSDPDEGVEIVDMDNVRQMDYMAPESLLKERQRTKVKKEVPKAEDDVDTSQALDLSESEDEEELEDVIEDFAAATDDQSADPTLHQDRLYFFQFPSPFPTFTEPGLPPPAPVEGQKRVSFAPSVKAEETGTSTPTSDAPPKITDGTIGSLEVYRSGAVKIRLANGILLDVVAGTQPSFLQQAVSLDLKEHTLSVLGEVNKRFVVSPDVDALLKAMEQAELKPRTVIEGEEGLIAMDTT